MVAASLPDLDIVFSLLSPLAYLYNHRGITHSFVLLPVWSLIFAWLCAKLWRGGPGWRAYFGVFAWGIGIHIVGDWITAFGTMFLEPLSDRRFALSTTFIIDLWLLAVAARGHARLHRVAAARACPPSRPSPASPGTSRSRAGSTTTRSSSASSTRGLKACGRRRCSACPPGLAVQLDGGGRGGGSHRLRAGAAHEATRAAGRPRHRAFIDRLAAPYEALHDAKWTRTARFGEAAVEPVARAAFGAPELGFFRWFAAVPRSTASTSATRRRACGSRTCASSRPGRDVTPFRYGVCRENEGPWTPFELDGDAPTPSLRAPGGAVIGQSSGPARRTR